MAYKSPTLYGVTHDPVTALPTVRVPRAVKIGIGKMQGTALHVYLANHEDGNPRWVIEIGRKTKTTDIKRESYKTKEEAAKRYFALKADASTPRTVFPEKLDYFTFLRPSATGDDGLDYDFDAIEKHGVKPRRVEVVFTDDNPFEAAYENWSKSALLCRGNGIDAMRSVDWPQTQEERQEAARVKAAGGLAFPIVGQCWTQGCRFAKPNEKGQKQCSVHGKLAMQLVNDIRLGSKCQYDTTGYRSTSQMFSNLWELATFTGGGDPASGYVRGIPLVLTMAPFRTKHNGIPGKAYAVALEFRAESLGAIKKKMLDFAENFSMGEPKQIAAPAKQLAAPAEVFTAEVLTFSSTDDGEDVGPEEAAAMAAEFDIGHTDEEAEMTYEPQDMETATVAATEELKQEIAPATPQTTLPAKRAFSIGAR